MRLQTCSAFDKHLLQIQKKEEISYFLLVANEFFDRKSLRELVLSHFKRVAPTYDLIRLDCAELTETQFYDECETTDLFGGVKILLVQNFEKASKGFLDAISGYLSDKKGLFIVFEGEQNKFEAKFYDTLKRELVVFDLSKEKPWEKKARALSLAHQKLLGEKKQFSKELLDHLFESSERQLSLFMQELEKLICYTGKEAVITSEAMSAICCFSRDVNTWSVCEKFIWEPSEETYQAALSLQVTSQEYFSLLGQLRYQCQLGLKLAQIQNQGAEEELWLKALNPSQQKQVSRYKRVVHHFQARFFSFALGILFEYEMKAKTESTDLELLWTSLILHLKNKQLIGI